MDDQREDIEEEHDGDISNARRTYLAYEIIGKRIVDRSGRHETRLTREYERAIRNFDRARQERSQQPPAAPEVSGQNEQNQPLTAEPPSEIKKLQNEPKHSDVHSSADSTPVTEPGRPLGTEGSGWDDKLPKCA
jgi:hypothetical protein